MTRSLREPAAVPAIPVLLMLLLLLLLAPALLSVLFEGSSPDRPVPAKRDCPDAPGVVAILDAVVVEERLFPPRTVLSCVRLPPPRPPVALPPKRSLIWPAIPDRFGEVALCRSCNDIAPPPAFVVALSSLSLLPDPSLSPLVPSTAVLLRSPSCCCCCCCCC